MLGADDVEPWEAGLMAKATAWALLNYARTDGLRIAPTDDGERIRVGGPADMRERWRADLVANKAQALRILLDAVCGGCGASQVPLVAVWWDDERLCRDCIALATEEFDREDWPAVRWNELDDVEEL